MVAMVCDNRLFVKPTADGRVFAGGMEAAAPYPAAKSCLLIVEDRWNDAEWMGSLIRATAAELPPSKAKRRRSTPA